MAIAGEEDIKQAFSQERLRRQMRGDVGRKRALEELSARESQTGGFGGAGLKLRQRALQDLERGLGEEEAGATAQEASQLGGLKFSAGEAEKEREFGREQAAEQRKLAREQLAQQETQFGRTLEFQKGSFAEQMKFNWSEFDENLRTNFINASIALKDAGFMDKEFDELANFWRSGFGSLFGPQSGRRVQAPAYPTPGSFNYPGNSAGTIYVRS